MNSMKKILVAIVAASTIGFTLAPVDASAYYKRCYYVPSHYSYGRFYPGRTICKVYGGYHYYHPYRYHHRYYRHW